MMLVAAADATWADLARDAGDDPFLRRCADPAFVAELESAARECTGLAATDEAEWPAAPPDALDLMVMSPRELLEHAASVPLDQRYALLARLDPNVLDEWEIEELALLMAGVLASVSAFQLRTRNALAARCRNSRVSYAATSLMHAENVSKTAAEGRLSYAREVINRLPRLTGALADGTISPDHLRLVRNATRTLTDAQCEAVEIRLMGELDRKPGELEKLALKAAAAVDPTSTEDRHDLGRVRRTAYTRPLPDGMALLGVVAPAEQVGLAWLEIDRRARMLRTAGDPRTLAQLRTDLILAAPRVAAAALERAERGQRGRRRAADPVKQGRRVRMVVHVELGSLFGAADVPAFIEGIGPVPAKVARSLVRHAEEWFRLVTDPSSGVCRDYGRLKKPGQDLTDFVVGRDQVCQCGCERPIDDLNHITERARGGATTDVNLEGLAEHCHTERTHGGWQPERGAAGRIVRTSPAGHRAVIRPLDHRLGLVQPIDAFQPESDPDPPPF